MEDNYFTFFGLDEAFSIDQRDLKKRYISNSKKYHPDFYSLEDETTQNQVLEKSTLNNKAWKVLSNEMSRIAYLLDLKGAMPAEGQAAVPQDFLMEMMDINEQLMELQFDDDPQAKANVLTAINSLKDQLDQEGRAAMAAWDEDQEASFLDAIRDYYLKSKYIARIMEQVG